MGTKGKHQQRGKATLGGRIGEGNNKRGSRWGVDTAGYRFKHSMKGERERGRHGEEWSASDEQEKKKKMKRK